ncbi:hydrolase [Rhodanobacter fulvus Jip2]|uniref:Hydrolase n=1 Tax=Rhodanobacter fulvus Jip2 TaxID=1163408 RepID=I4VSU5_9GAMM|nr:alpha/beta hydrolase [Rhodanobacter fulvus]EIL90286.1 hydrolase [Rhodanobacter fulvus Jip2]
MSISRAAGRIAAMEKNRLPRVVLVHDAWFDGSSWNEAMSRLQAHGLDVLAVSNPLQSLAGDVAVVRRVLDAISGPVILVGHGWGGTVITQAATTGNVAALVYVAGLAPDQGESVRSLRACDPELEQLPRTRSDEAGYIHFERTGFSYYLAHDLPLIQANVLAAVDAPIHCDALEEVIDQPAWRGLPAWYVVTTQDRIVLPASQHRMATRMRAQVREIGASHVPFLSRPREFIEVILEAVARAC